ncbi:glycoside hydrolase family 57 protein [Chondromyces crocatus]|nr:1,4-alpha-glucan branching protein domain-containing protein [Chondromyces crocatus]
MHGHIALVLHAHLPYVRHPEHPRSFEERWLFEALWESYLPLLGVLDRLAAEGVRAPIALSVSPTLAAMLRDALLCRRFELHVQRTEALAKRVGQVLGAGVFAPALAFYRDRLEAAWAVWEGCDGDVLGALQRHARAGHVELFSTAATHAFLPGLLPTPASVRAQVRLGRQGFGALVHGDAARAPAGFWLPECGWDPRLAPDLSSAGVVWTVVDEHALSPSTGSAVAGRVAAGSAAATGLVPVRSASGVVFFGRDRVSAREVWSREEGYPGHPDYREFYRDVGHDLDESVLGDELGPDGSRLMTGLKLHRITGPDADKAPYDPVAASARARLHAAAFVARRREHLARAIEVAETGNEGSRGTPPVVVAAYDAELFGHWWLEGPMFLEHVLRMLGGEGRGGRSSEEGRATAGLLTPGAYVERHGTSVGADPVASTWGEGGFGTVWIGQRTARLWRHVHHAEGPVRAAVQRVRALGEEGVRGAAVDQAVRELLLLQASDWAFMIDRGEMTSYAEARVRTHVIRSRRLAEFASRGGGSPEDDAWVGSVCRHAPFLAEVSGEALREMLVPGGRESA